MAVVEYLKDRLRTLKPTLDPATNPFRLWASLTLRQWAYFLVGFFAWTWDAFDFHTVTMTYPELADDFGKTATEISVAVTLVLMFRPLGAAVFGLAADRFGRKWPFIANNVLLVFFELGTGFCDTYSAFLAVRALFGFAMGGIYGNAAATALEDCPDAVRGLMSGIFQSGYPFGYLLATVFWKAFDKTRHGWKTLFWFGACPPVILIVARLFMAETDTFQERLPHRGTRPSVSDFLEEMKLVVTKHWPLLFYLILLMTGFNFLSHGTQDLYPLMLRNKYHFNSTRITLVQVIANLGGMIGGTIVGYVSQIFGRRFSIVATCVLGAALLRPYTDASGPSLYAAAFFEQFCVQGAWGVIPIHLIELSPAAFRTLVVGTSYQLGNLVSSASNSIETTLGERYPRPDRDGEKIYDYSLVICIFAACIFVYMVLMTAIGPERKGFALKDVDEDEEMEREVGASTWNMQTTGQERRY